MEDIKTKDDIKSSWLIEETYSSEKCRHKSDDQRQLNGKTINFCTKNEGWQVCIKDNCKIKIGK